MRFNNGFNPREEIVKKLRSLTGFTFVELMVTIVIIGILVGITVPGFKRQQETAKCSQAMSNLTTMRNAAFDYYAANQTFIGMTVANLSTRANANFSNTADWTYDLINLSASAFTIRASRTRGPWAVGRSILTLNQDNAWNTPAVEYPWNNPGGF